ncbi:exported hypothetical protein [Verrucomicrobia bacterium]|nr:exported hypothetical protein [Verrucomicrobiota bacterium]
MRMNINGKTSGGVGFSRFRATLPARSTLLSLIALLAVFALGGCSKSSPPPTADVAPHLDTAKLRQAFPAPSPEIRRNLDQVVFGARYGKFSQSLEALDKIAADPSLTDPQKQAVNDARDQAKKLADAEAAKPAQ